MPPERENLTLKSKVQVIRDIESGMNYNDIVSKYRLKNKSNVTIIKNQKKEILNAFSSRSTGCKSLKTAKYPILDTRLIRFMDDMTSKGAIVTLDLLTEKAKTFMEEEGITDMMATRGYIQKMMKRNNAGLQIKHGESFSVSQTTIDDWKKKLLVHIEGYDEDGIFNSDKLGLFYKLLPTKTLPVKGKKLSNVSLAKDRVSILLGANVSGTEKLPLLMIGRYSQSY